MTRIMELAQQSANGTFSVSQRKALDKEAQTLSKEYLRIVQSTKFNGLHLLDGSIDELSLQAAFSKISSGVGGDKGTGEFGSASVLNLGVAPSDTAMGDVNGDGFLDIVISDFTGYSISFQLGNGDGTFRAGMSVSSSQNGGGISLSDLNGDGNLDIISSAGNGYEIHLGNGDGSFRSGTTYNLGNPVGEFSLADFNGDGNIDIVSGFGGTSLVVSLGTGTGSFQTFATLTVGPGVNRLSIGDINGDGAVDILASSGASENMFLFTGNGNGNFGTLPTLNGTGGILGDVNNDGYLDILSDTGIRLGNGNGTFGTETGFPDSGTTIPYLYDLNGDGNLDIISGNNGATIRLGNGNGTFGAEYVYGMGAIPLAPLIGDFNGDGVLDLGSADSDSGTFYIRLAATEDGIGALLPFSLTSVADARQAMPILDRALDSLTLQNSVLGAFQSRISVAKGLLESSRVNYSAAESRIRDADIASDSAEYIRLQILQEAASKVLRTANLIPEIALSLLKNGED